MTKKMDLPTKKLNAATLLISSLLFSSAAMSKDYLASAKAYLADNETNAAIIELKNAIKEMPKDNTARFLLGKAYLEQGNFLAAEHQLARALKYDYNKDEVAPLIARAMINQSKHEDSFLLINDLYPDKKQMPDSLLALAAMAEMRLNRLDSAKLLLAQAKENNFYTEMADALLDFVSNDKKAASTKIDRMVEAYPEQSDLWLLKGHIDFSLNHFEPAYESYLNAYRFAPNAHQYNYYISRSLVQLNRFDEALPVIDALLSASPDNPFVNELKAIAVFAKKDFTAAKLHADKALNNGVQNFRLSSISGVSAFYLDQLEHAYKQMKPLVKELDPNHPLNRLYIITQFKLGYVDDAIKNLDRFAVESSIDSEFLSRVSIELINIGRNDLALTLANKAATKAEGETETLLNFIKLANDDTTGIDSLLASVEGDSSNRIKQGLANYYFSAGKLDEAEKIADQWLEVSTEDQVALAMKGVIYQRRGEMDKAVAAFEKIRSMDDKNLQAIAELAKIALSQQQTDKGLALLTEAKTYAPNNGKIARLYLQEFSKAGRIKDAIALIDQQIEAEPLNLDRRLQKADALVLNGDRRAAIILLETLPNKNKLVWRKLSSLYLAMQDRNNLAKSNAEWLKQDDFNPLAYLNNVRFHIEDGALIEAANINAEARQRFPLDGRFMLAQTEILLRQQQIQAANEMFKQVPAEQQQNLEYLRVQGMVQQANRDYAALVKTNELRFNLKQSYNTARELASAYLMNQQKDVAIAFLSELLTKLGEQQHEQAMGLKTQLAEMLLAEDADKAISLYSDVVSVQPNNVLALNNLSWLLAERQDFSNACPYAERAHNLAKQSPSIADTYGYCLLKTGNAKKAANLLEYAHSERKDDITIALHFAEALIEIKQASKAMKVLAGINPNTPDLIARKNWLEKTVVSLTQ